MAIILSFVLRLVPNSVMVSVVPKVVLSAMMVPAVLRGVCATVMAGKRVAIFRASLAIAMRTAAVIVTGVGHSSSQSGEHDGKQKYPHFPTSHPQRLAERCDRLLKVRSLPEMR
jgi:hypothetical protein